MLYEKFLELKSMKDVKEALGSRRGIKDMWNHLFAADRKRLKMTIKDYNKIRPERVQLFREKEKKKEEEKAIKKA